MPRKLAILAVLCCGATILAMMFFAKRPGQEEGITIKQRLQCEQIINLTRDEMQLLQEKVAVLNELIPESDRIGNDHEKQQWATELSEVQSRLAVVKGAIAELEDALAKDSPEAMEGVLRKLKSR